VASGVCALSDVLWGSGYCVAALFAGKASTTVCGMRVLKGVEGWGGEGACPADDAISGD
jgi:hypothetical protein